MDPDATLSIIDTLLKERRGSDVIDYHCQDLYDWIAKGGFEPEWGRCELGTSYYNCRAVYHRRGERVVD
jgi:hypothetical protein